MHMLDFEHRKIYHSTSFVDLNETSIDYYHKKLEKDFNETRTATLHLKKIEPLNTCENDRDDGYKKTEGQRANTNY